MALRERLLELCELSALSPVPDDEGGPDRLALPHELDCARCQPR
jgi:hypothetical protein